MMPAWPLGRLAAVVLTAAMGTPEVPPATPASRPTAPPSQTEEDEPELTPAERERLNARIADLVGQLGDTDWRRREAASEELLKIGAPAREALTEAAATSKDAEVVWRAESLLRELKTIIRKKVDPNCTNGYQLVYAGTQQVQTFKAPAASIESLRLRLARTLALPFAPLTVELRDPVKPDGDPLASANLQAEWDDEKGIRRGVARLFAWFTLDLKAQNVEKGKTYELVLSSNTRQQNPWLVNCFYRDTYPDGQHRQRTAARTVELGQFDLVFEVILGKEKVTSVPKDAALEDRKEHYGVGHDGTVLPDEPAAPTPGLPVPVVPVPLLMRG